HSPRRHRILHQHHPARRLREDGRRALDYITADVAQEGKPDEFMSKTKWQRFQIYVAGPLMNMLLALVIMSFVFYAGAAEFLYLKKPALIGAVAPGSAADKAGIKPGDLIPSVAGKTIDTWDRLELVVMPRAGREVPVTIRRGSEDLSLPVTGESSPKYEMGARGVLPEVHPQVSAVFPDEPAAKAGLENGDVVMALNGGPI